MEVHALGDCNVGPVEHPESKIMLLDGNTRYEATARVVVDSRLGLRTAGFVPAWSAGAAAGGVRRKSWSLSRCMVIK